MRTRTWVALVVTVAVAAGVLGVSADRSTASVAPPPLSAPFVVEFDLYHELYAFDDPSAAPNALDTNSDGTVMTTDRFRWTFSDWDSWTFSQTCCEDPVDPSISRFGWTKEVHPDGTSRYRPEATAPWEISAAPPDGSTPLPDLAPRWTGSRLVDRVAIIDTIDGGPEVAAALGIDPDDVAVYVRGSTTTAVFTPLGLPVLSVETNTAGEVIRRLEVTAIREP